MAVYFFAIAAGLCFGLGSVVQQRVASVAPPGKSLRFSLLFWLVRQPAWLVGVATALVGNGFSAAALGVGSVALVQPLLVSRLLFAVPLSAAWVRQRLTARDWLGLVATAGGLATFVIVGRPEQGEEAGPTPLWQWVVVVGAIAGLTGALVAVARKLSPAREAPILGAGAGMLFALQAAFMHVAVDNFIDDGLVGMLTDWTTYAVAAAAIIGTLLAQSAYEMAPLASSYPALAAVEPLAAIGISIGVLGSILALGGALPVGVLVVALSVMTYGIYLLATSPLVTGQQHTMERRRLEELVADAERDLDHDLDKLAGVVRKLEDCRREERPRATVVDRQLERLDELLECIDRRLLELTDLNRQAEAEGGPPEDEHILSDEHGGIHDVHPHDLHPRAPEEALTQYHRDNRRRERELRARARELRRQACELRDAIEAQRQRS